VSKESGIADSPGKSFGAVATDVNNDGLMDLFVANDTMPNFLFVNKGGGKFEESGSRRASPTARRASRVRGWALMRPTSTATGGRISSSRTSIRSSSASITTRRTDLHRRARRDRRRDASAERLGLKFFDYDNDGDPDLFLVNGHPDDMIEMRTAR
jgi:hypothetical protein